MGKNYLFDIGIIALKEDEKVVEILKSFLEKDGFCIGSWLIEGEKNADDAYDFAKNKSDYLLLIVTQSFLEDEQGIQALHIGAAKSKLQNCRKIFVIQMEKVSVEFERSFYVLQAREEKSCDIAIKVSNIISEEQKKGITENKEENLKRYGGIVIADTINGSKFF